MKCIIQCPHLKPPIKNSYRMCFLNCKHKPFDRSYSSYLRILQAIKKEEMNIIHEQDILREILNELYAEGYIHHKYNSDVSGGMKQSWKEFIKDHEKEFTAVSLTIKGHQTLNDLIRNSLKGRMIAHAITILLVLSGAVFSGIFTRLHS